MRAKVLTIENMTKSYIGDGYEVKALKKVSLDLFQGELLVLMGTSGSGKSTLLNIIGALDKPDSGDIYINGKKHNHIFEEPHATSYRAENIGFIFQSFNLLKDLTVEENIALPMILRGREMKQEVESILEIIGLKQWRDHRPHQLSGGQQQRVAIGRALITYPPILLADEPTGNLDFNAATHLLQMMVDLKRMRNQSIILVSHDPYVASFADRVIFIHEGRIADQITDNEDKNVEHILNKMKQMLRSKNE